MGKTLFATITIIVLITLSLFFVSKDVENFTGFALTNPIKVCNEVEVPYEVEEPYTIEEPYQEIKQVTVPLNYEIISKNEDVLDLGDSLLITSHITLRNTDDKTGTFSITQTLKTPGKDYEKITNKFITAGAMKEFSEQFSIKKTDYLLEYSIEPSKKTGTQGVTGYTTLTQYKTVIKYKFEEVCE
jgi:hypothetical protein